MKHFYDAGQVYQAELSRNRTFAAQTLVPAYRVGQPLRQSQRTWPEGAQFTHGRGGHELTLFRSDINLAIIDDISRGAGEFAPWSSTRSLCWRIASANPSSGTMFPIAGTFSLSIQGRCLQLFLKPKRVPYCGLRWSVPKTALFVRRGD